MSTFYEQLGNVTGVFEQWGTCERTVVLCALARRVPWAGLKLLQRSVEAALARDAPTPAEGERLEREANDEAQLAALLASKGDTEEDDEDYLRKLVSLLPLLHVENERAKQVYVSAAPVLVQRCVDGPRRRHAELCRQMLSYLLVHPALTNNDQRTLTQWLRYLENHMAGNSNTEGAVWQTRIEPGLLYNSNIWASSTTFRRTIGKNVEFRGVADPAKDHAYNADLLQESFSKNGRDVDISLDGDKLNFDVTISQPKSQRSNSLTPPSSTMMHMSSSAENLSDELFVQKPRSFSLSSEGLGHIRPISIMYGTTGSETRLDDLRSNNFVEYPGMSTVAQWLKSLRLHKYVWLFSNISYDQMMAIDEEYLEKLGVTKGARHKLLLSIGKLRERHTALGALEKELSARPPPPPPVMARLLERLRTVLLSPMPAASDLPAHIVRLLELASKTMLSGGGGGMAAPRLPFQCHLYDEGSLIDHDFNAVDPVSLHCWLVEKALHHESFNTAELTEALKRMRYRLPPRQFFHHVSDTPLNSRGPKPRWRPHPHNGYVKGHTKRPWVPPLPRGKSHSYPPYPPPGARSPRPPALSTNPAPPTPLADIDSSLDALCLQMTEQAIN